MVDGPEILAAGAVVARRGQEVLLVHRPKYDDWSFPKGKADPGEHVTAAAFREVEEETGLRIRLGPPLGPQRYTVQNGQSRVKHVRYWAARAVGSDDVSKYRPNAEIDKVAWVPVEDAERLLTYDRDRTTLEEAAPYRKKSHPLIVLRHGKAKPRKKWKKDDRERPLNKVGRGQAAELVPVLGAYGVRRVLSSTSRRCWCTVSPYVDAAELDLQVTRDLSEEDASAKAISRHVHRLLDKPEPAVVCTHRPVLPYVYDALGVPDPKLEAGAMLVVHHRAGQLLAVEQHQL
ncbi:MAG: 8-oxo-(d)GTP phosphatase [Nocardioidaceae bacterium]|jgi:8-oxo-dGTP diphosphatase|nr:8-oxo-(d)GTP phosphatase [Nocardioidaceae bacterium]